MQLSIYASNLICLAFERFWLLAGEGAHVFVIAWPPDERFSPRPCKCSTLSPWAQPTTWSQDCTVMSLCSMLTPKTYSTSHNRKAFDQSDGSSAGAVDMLPVPHVERSLLSAWLTAEILWSDQSADLSSQSGTPLKSRKENDVNFSGKKKKKTKTPYWYKSMFEPTHFFWVNTTGTRQRSTATSRWQRSGGESWDTIFSKKGWRVWDSLEIQKRGGGLQSKAVKMWMCGGVGWCRRREKQRRARKRRNRPCCKNQVIESSWSELQPPGFFFFFFFLS